MHDRLRAFIEKNRLLQPGETVAVGYSGGADSACLLHLLKETGYAPVAAHLHHGQRPEADEEMRRCEETADALAVPFMAGNADVPALAAEMKIGIEEAGRNLRYEFFRKVSFQLGGVKVATAHTLDDRVETMLFHLARGTGLAGLAGIPVRREGIIRPLLFARREETRRYCEERAIWFHDDPANLDPKFSRTLIRLNAIPALEQVNPKALENAARLADLAEEEDALLDGMAAAMLESCEIQSDHPLAFLAASSEITLDRAALAHHPAPLIRRGVRLVARALDASPEYDQIASAVASLATEGRFSVTFAGGEVVLEATEGRALMRSLRPVEAYRQPLSVPGETISDELGWSVAVYNTDENPPEENRALRAVIDASAVKGSLYVRPFQPGDRMRPIGMESEKKLQDLLTNAGVTGAIKARLPIVCDMVGPIWIPGVSVAHRAAVDGSQRRLGLRFSSASEP